MNWLRFAKHTGLGVIPYSPLAGGFLSGKYRKDQTEAGSQRNVSRYFTDYGWKVLDAVDEIARQRGVSISQIALAWLLTQPGITSPIIGPRSIEQLEDNLGAADLSLTKDEMEKLNEVSRWQ